MTKNEQTMLDMGCPECGGDIELYDTNPSGTSGRYRCKECPRDTVWAVGKAMSFTDVVKEMQAKMGQMPNGNSEAFRACEK